MNLPQLLRRLRTTASQRDRRGVLETLDILSRAGYSSDVDAFVRQLPAQDAATVNEFARPEPPDSQVAMRFNAFGQRAGGGGSQPDLLAGVTRDAASQIWYPSTAAEWATFIVGKGLAVAVPNSLWLCQEASGNLADSIGAVTLTAAGAPTYQTTVAGSTRKGVTLADASSDNFSAGAGVGPSPATTSQTWLTVLMFPATPGVVRLIGGINTHSATVESRFLHSVGGKLTFQVVGTTVNSASVHSSGLHPIANKYDRTNAAAVLYSNLDLTVGTYNAGVVDGLKGFGSDALSASACTMIYGAMWSGAAGEISDSAMRALYQAMGFTVGW